MALECQSWGFAVDLRVWRIVSLVDHRGIVMKVRYTFNAEFGILQGLVIEVEVLDQDAAILLHDMLVIGNRETVGQYDIQMEMDIA